MKTYTWEEVNRDYVEDVSTEWVPADVAQRLYDQLETALELMESVWDAEGHYTCPEDIQDVKDALAAADGD